MFKPQPSGSSTSRSSRLGTRRGSRIESATADADEMDSDDETGGSNDEVPPPARETPASQLMLHDPVHEVAYGS